MTAIRNLFVWLVSVAVVPVAMVYHNDQVWYAGDAACFALASGILASIIVFLLFGPYINGILQQQIVLQEVERDELDNDCESKLVESKEANNVWQDTINELMLCEVSQEQLLTEYRKVLLAMWDTVDPFYAEELATERLSEVLKAGNWSRYYSFRRFCKSLGK